MIELILKFDFQKGLILWKQHFAGPCKFVTEYVYYRHEQFIFFYILTKATYMLIRFKTLKRQPTMSQMYIASSVIFGNMFSPTRWLNGERYTCKNICLEISNQFQYGELISILTFVEYDLVIYIRNTQCRYWEQSTDFYCQLHMWLMFIIILYENLKNYLSLRN